MTNESAINRKVGIAFRHTNIENRQLMIQVITSYLITYWRYIFFISNHCCNHVTVGYATLFLSKTHHLPYATPVRWTKYRSLKMTQIHEILTPLFERLDRIESMIMKTETPRLMTLKDVAQYSNLSEPTIRRSIMRGTLKPFKEVGKKLFRKVDVDRWLKG